MKKIFIFFLFLISIRGLAFDQGYVKYWPNGFKKEEKIIFFTKDRVEMFENWFDFENVNIDGEFTFRTWYVNGRMKSEEHFFNKKRNGRCSYYEESGSLIFAGEFDGKQYSDPLDKTAPEKVWKRNGCPKSIWLPGFLDTIVKSYSRADLHYKNGIRIHVEPGYKTTVYDSLDRKMAYVDFNNGEWSEFYEDGSKKVVAWIETIPVCLDDDADTYLQLFISIFSKCRNPGKASVFKSIKQFDDQGKLRVHMVREKKLIITDEKKDTWKYKWIEGKWVLEEGKEKLHP